ncbi:hypothetical protein [Streptomyces sp. NPDC002788]
MLPRRVHTCTAVCLEWLRDTESERERVREVCARALLGVLAL